MASATQTGKPTEEDYKRVAKQQRDQLGRQFMRGEMDLYDPGADDKIRNIINIEDITPTDRLTLAQMHVVAAKAHIAPKSGSMEADAALAAVYLRIAFTMLEVEPQLSAKMAEKVTTMAAPEKVVEALDSFIDVMKGRVTELGSTDNLKAKEVLTRAADALKQI